MILTINGQIALDDCMVSVVSIVPVSFAREDFGDV
jgi:hypothetical protein